MFAEAVRPAFFGVIRGSITGCCAPVTARIIARATRWLADPKRTGARSLGSPWPAAVNDVAAEGSAMIIGG
jgi:hypothetical protein